MLLSLNNFSSRSMYSNISTKLLKMAETIYVLSSESYLYSDIPGIFAIFEDFITKLSPEDLDKSKIPLTLSKQGLKTLKEKLAKFPLIYSSGTVSMKEVSFLYVVGQFLTSLWAKMQVLKAHFEEKECEVEIKKIDEEDKKLTEIWGRLNAGHLYSTFENKEDDFTSKELKEKLKKSQSIFK